MDSLNLAADRLADLLSTPAIEVWKPSIFPRLQHLSSFGLSAPPLVPNHPWLISKSSDFFMLEMVTSIL